jgi:iron complex outermembrane receptor protein
MNIRPVLLSLTIAAPLPAVAADMETGTLAEVVVTAQKREQSLLDVGIDISVVTGDDLERLRVDEIDDLSRHISNMNVKNTLGATNPVVTIRGVGLNDFNANSSPTAGVYVDEIFLTSTAMMGFQLFDMDRVEVLKGPQGTLYGRNTTAGAVSFITRKPTRELEAYAQAGYGDHRTFESEAAVGGPLGEALAFRLAARYEDQGTGFSEDRVSGNDFGAADRIAWRAQLAWEPSDTLAATLNVHGGTDRSNSYGIEHFGTQDPVTFDVCQPILEGRVDPSGCVDFFGYSDTDGDPYQGDYDLLSRVDVKSLGASVQVAADLGAVRLTSITGYESLERKQAEDFDGSPFRSVDSTWDANVDQYSQELRLSGSAGTSMDWILGLFYSKDTVDSVVDGNFSDLVALFSGGAVSDERLRNLIDQDTTAWAAFAHTKWKLSDQLSLTLAARFTDEEKDYTGTATDLTLLAGTGGGFFGLGDPNCATGQVACNIDDRIDDTNVSWRAALDFKPSEDWLTYVSISKGYKSGGFNGGFVSRSEVLAPFDREEVLAYELGAKANLLGGAMRASGAVFYYDYNDVQTQVQVNVGNLSVIRLGNVPEAEVLGAELELRWLPTAGLDLGLGLSWLDTELGAFASPVGPVPAGNELPNAPRFSLVSDARYEVPVGDYSLAFGVNARYSDSAFRDSLNQRLLWSEASWVYNANIELASSTTWSLSLWGRNLTDEQVAQSAGNNGIGNGFTLTQQPRTFGATFKYSFR